MTEPTSPLAPLADGLAGVEAFADAVGGRSRFWGWLSLLGGAAAWAIMLRNWVFDSIPAFGAWSPLLVGFLIPGIILLGFGRKARRLADLPDRITEDLGEVAQEARSGVAQGYTGAKAAGLGGLRSLLGSLRDLGKYGDEVGGIVAGVAGSIRMLNPLYLGMVGLAALGAGMVLLVLVIAVVVLVV